MNQRRDQVACLTDEQLEQMTTSELAALLNQIARVLQRRPDVSMKELLIAAGLGHILRSTSTQSMMELRPGDEHADRCPENITRYTIDSDVHVPPRPGHTDDQEEFTEKTR